MESIIKVLNAIGKFEIDYSKFSDVTRTLHLAFPRFGLPMYLANNILKIIFLII